VVREPMQFEAVRWLRKKMVNREVNERVEACLKLFGLKQPIGETIPFKKSA
jgi:hypothetical protein